MSVGNFRKTSSEISTISKINIDRQDEKNDRIILDYAVKIRDRKIEHAFVFDRNYEHLFSLKGNRWKIQFSHREIMRLFGTIFMHNHPRGGSFSINDIYTACACSMRGMIAVTGSLIYIIMPPEGEECFSRTMYRDISKCFKIRSCRLPLNLRLSAPDILWEAVARDMDLRYYCMTYEDRPVKESNLIHS